MRLSGKEKNNQGVSLLGLVPGRQLLRTGLIMLLRQTYISLQLIIKHWYIRLHRAGLRYTELTLLTLEWGQTLLSNVMLDIK